MKTLAIEIERDHMDQAVGNEGRINLITGELHRHDIDGVDLITIHVGEPEGTDGAVAMLAERNKGTDT